MKVKKDIKVCGGVEGFGRWGWGHADDSCWLSLQTALEPPSGSRLAADLVQHSKRHSGAVQVEAHKQLHSTAQLLMPSCMMGTNQARWACTHVCVTSYAHPVGYSLA